jgi:probable F420-dependent oxidoreductase
MRFVIGLPTDDVHKRDEFGTAEAVTEMARRVEELGYEAIYVTDHPAPTRKYIEGGGHHALEPTVVLSMAAAVTTRLRLMSNLYVVAYRNPFIAAKAIATLDSLSSGRVIVGTGAGYLKPEFNALGVDFERRNEILDANIELMKRIWSGEPVVADGPGWRADETVALPLPTQRPHPPIWIGGNSPRARRRAVELADGWIPMPAPRKFASYVRSTPLESVDDLRAALAYLHQHAEKLGRSKPLDVMFGPFHANYGEKGFDLGVYRAGCDELEALGVGYAGVQFAYPGRGMIESRKRFLELAEGFARDVMQR